MEFEIGVKLKVSIKDLETNVNEIARAVKEVMRGIGRDIFKEVLSVYQLRVREFLLKGSLVFPHDECPGDKGFKGRGFRGRNLKTEVGDIGFELAMVECRCCGGVISPFLNIIGVVSWRGYRKG